MGRFENATSSGQVENEICQVQVSYISSCLRHACPLFNMAAKTVQQLTVHLLCMIEISMSDQLYLWHVTPCVQNAVIHDVTGGLNDSLENRKTEITMKRFILGQLLTSS